MSNYRQIPVFILTVLTMTLLSLSITAKAKDNDTIQMRMSEKTWVNSDKAKVTISVNTILHEANLADIKDKIQNRLARIYGKQDFNIVRFKRSETDAGLEKIQALAQGRLKEKQLTELRQQVKTLSESGFNMQVVNIQFKPALAEREASLNQLRQRIYKRVKQEIDQLQKTFSDGEFTIDSIRFHSPEDSSRTMARTVQLQAQQAPAQTNEPLEVSTKQKLVADIAIKRATNE